MRARTPIAYACVRWFSDLDQESHEPAGCFLSAWRISRLGDISGPFTDPPGADGVAYPCTIVEEFKINFAFGEGVCALESFSPSGEVERLVRGFAGSGSDVLGDLIGEVRRDRVNPNKYDPCLPKRWSVRR